MSGHFCYQNRTFRTFLINQFPTLQNCHNLLNLAILLAKFIYPFRPNVLLKCKNIPILIFKICIKKARGLKYSCYLVFKFGPGGIRTHDQRIMSPLRYRCATGPLCATYLFNFNGLALACATYLSLECDI